MASKFAALIAASATVVAVALSPGSASAQWWNPFKHDEQPQPQPDTSRRQAPVPPGVVGGGQGGGQGRGAATAGGGGGGYPAASAPGYLAGTTGGGTVGGQSAGAPGNGGGAAVAATPPEPSTRMDRIEAQMRTITGQIEQLTYQLQQLQDEVAGLQPGGGQPHADAGTAGKRVAQRDTGLATDAAESVPDPIGTAIGNTGAIQRGDPPRVLGTVPANGGGPIDLAALANGGQPGGGAAAGGPVTRGISPGVATGTGGAATGTGTAGTGAVAAVAPATRTGNPKDDYDRAYSRILTGDYAEAEKGLRAFIATYPADTRASDAEYWLGESLFQRALYREAAEEFLTGYKAYPKGGKAPDTLLKLGLSLKSLGEREAACQTYSELVKKYPTAGNSLIQRVKAEQKMANCT